MPPDAPADEVRFALPTDDPATDVARVAEIVGTFDVTGLVVDGEQAGAPGWIVVRTLGNADVSTLLRYDAQTDSVAMDLPWSTVADALRHAIGVEVQVGTRISFGGHDLVENGLLALGGEHRAVLVAPLGDYMFRASAAGIGHDLTAAPVGDRVVVMRRDVPSDDELVLDLSGGLIGATAALGRRTGLVLWRRGTVLSYALTTKGRMVDGQVWEPRGTTIEPVSLHRHGLADLVADVVDDLTATGSDGAGLVRAFGVDADRAVALRSLLRRDRADVVELVQVLGLPVEVGELFEGRLDVSDLPGATTYEALSVRGAVVAEMRGKQRLGRADGSTGRSRWRRG